MNRFAKKQETEQAGPSLPSAPAKCGCFGCDGDAFIAMAVCRVGSGDAQVGMIGRRAKEPPSFSRKVPGQGWLSTPDFHFVRWIARCTQCYVRENRLDRGMESALGNA